MGRGGSNHHARRSGNGEASFSEMQKRVRNLVSCWRRRRRLGSLWPPIHHRCMSHELLIYSIKTFYGCVTIYLSISDSPGRLPWGSSHIQSWPLWHTLLSLFKYPVTSPSGPDTHRHVIKGNISPQPGLPSCACGDGLIFSGRDPLQEIVI